MPVLKRILPVLDFKVISRNSDCFGEYITEYTNLNFSTVSLVDHLLLPATFGKSVTVAAFPTALMAKEHRRKQLRAFHTP